jgi:hypothetical protein
VRATIREIQCRSSTPTKMEQLLQQSRKIEIVSIVLA